MFVGREELELLPPSRATKRDALDRARRATMHLVSQNAETINRLVEQGEFL